MLGLICLHTWLYILNFIFIYSKCPSLESVIFESRCPGLPRTVLVFISYCDAAVTGFPFTQSTGISIKGLVTNRMGQHLGHGALSQRLYFRLLFASAITTKMKIKTFSTILHIHRFWWCRK